MKRHDRIVIQGFKPGDVVFSCGAKFVYAPRPSEPKKPWLLDMNDEHNYTRYPNDTTDWFSCKEIANLDFGDFDVTIRLRRG